MQPLGVKNGSAVSLTVRRVGWNRGSSVLFSARKSSSVLFSLQMRRVFMELHGATSFNIKAASLCILYVHLHCTAAGIFCIHRLVSTTMIKTVGRGHLLPPPNIYVLVASSTVSSVVQRPATSFSVSSAMGDKHGDRVESSRSAKFRSMVSKARRLRKLV